MKKRNDDVVATFNLCESLCPFVKLEEPSTLHGYRIYVLDLSPFRYILVYKYSVQYKHSFAICILNRKFLKALSIKHA